MKKILYLSAVILLSHFCVLSSWASGDGFKFFGDNIEQAKEDGPYTANITVGQSLEILARGFAYPGVEFENVPSPQELEEAAKGEPFEAKAGTWMFDYEKLRLVNTESEPLQHKIVLEATTPGQYTVRFVGVLLGVSSREIQVNVSPRKDK